MVSTSVNGETGVVVIDAADVGAVAKTGDTMKHYVYTTVLAFFALCSQAFATSLLPTRT